MSEYSRRIFAFSAVAIIVAIGLSVGIAFLPSMMATSSLTTQTQQMTTSSAPASSVVPSITTATIPTTGSVYSATSTITSGTIITATQTTTASPTISETTTSTQLPAGYNLTWQWTFPISINYSGSWTLSYQGYNGTAESVNAIQNGTGFYAFSVTLHSRGYTQLKLCASATELSQENSTLILKVDSQSNSTSGSIRSTEVCYSIVHL